MPIMQTPSIPDLTDRAREIFHALVEAYLSTGTPVGSRTLSRQISHRLSSATVRNVMQDLEEMGLLSSPHSSAGRVPSEIGLRLFVDAMLETSDLPSADVSSIEAAVGASQQPTEQVLREAGKMLSGLSHGLSLVLAPNRDTAVEHVEFLQVSNGSTLVSLAMQDGHVENRLFDTPVGMTQSVAQQAANYLNARIRGRTLSEASQEITKSMEDDRRQLDSAVEDLVKEGLATWEGAGQEPDRLIVRGVSNLLDSAVAEGDLDRLRRLLDDLERQRTAAQLLELARDGEGVRVFIGSENPMFSLSGSSLVISPYMNGQRQVIGALAVVGPTSLNYGRVVPAVDYTARLVGRLLEGSADEEAEERLSGEV